MSKLFVGSHCDAGIALHLDCRRSKGRPQVARDPGEVEALGVSRSKVISVSSDLNYYCRAPASVGAGAAVLVFFVALLVSAPAGQVGSSWICSSSRAPQH